MTVEPVAVEPPKHPLYALTSYELRDYRHELERAIAFLEKTDAMPRHGPACRQGWMT
jgi:hypothetical protein